MKSKVFFWRRMFSAILDLSAIYCLASVLQFIIYHVIYLPYTYLFNIIFMGYYSLCYLLMEGKTPAKIFTGIRIIKKKPEKGLLFTVFLREIVAKGIIGIIIPLILFVLVPDKVIYPFVLIRMMLVIILSVLLLIIFKATWWEWISGTVTVKDSDTSRRKIISGFSFFSGLYLVFVLLSVAPFLSKKENIFNRWPLPYPENDEVKEYSGFIKDHSRDPVDYIFDLFKKYDIVVVSERMHPEYSQYEFFFKVFRDPRFAENAGNIFTEIGSVSYQDSLDKYLDTRFSNEEDFNRGTSGLQRDFNAVWPLWDNTNMFDMFKTIHSLNESLPDSLRINWYFTDLPVNWKTATHETYMANYTNPHRDSLMAVQVIEKYRDVLTKQRRHKALVIMNTYHGYGLQPDGKNYFGGTAAYIMKALPGKVANVMLNFISQKYLWFYMPVAGGKWDASFGAAGNPAAGFDFEGSPFGEDEFDARGVYYKNIRYKDVFTGFIFYTPLYEQVCKNGFPCEFENAQELIRRGECVSSEYSDMIRRNSREQADKNGVREVTPAKLALVYNMINVIALPFVMFVLFLIVMIIFAVKIAHLKL